MNKKYKSNCIILSIVVLSFFCTILKADPGSLESFPNQNSDFDSLNVRFVGNWPFGSAARGVANDSARNLMFLGSSGGVYILDISDPQDPTKLSELIHTRSCVYDLFYMNSVQQLFIADNHTGLEIWDIADPVSPAKLGYCDTPGWARGVYVQGTYAYVADYRSLSIIDISAPTNPQEVGSCDIAGDPMNVYVSGSYAYLAANRGGLVIVDVSTPTNPQVIGHCGTPIAASDVNISGSYAYVTDLGYEPEDSSALCVIDVSAPSNPIEVGRLALGRNSYMNCELQLRDTLVYIACDSFLVVNISDPFNPYEVGTCYEHGNSVSVAGDYAYVASYQEGLVIDISIPSNPQLIAQHEIPDMAYDVFVSEPYAYLADGLAGMRIIDISTPSNPFEIGFCSINGTTWSIYAVGDYVYFPYKVGWHDSMHLAVIDVSDPSNPQQIGDCQADYPNQGGAMGIHVLGPYAYIMIKNIWVSGQGGLWIVDVSDPSNPRGVSLSMSELDGDCYGVYVVDTIAYLTADDLYVVDVSDPSNPQQLGYCSTTAWAYGVHVSGSYAYVTDGAIGPDVGLRVIDVSDPTVPQEVGYCPTPNGPLRLHVSDSLAYVATYYGLRIIDVSSPSNPQEGGYYYTPYGMCGVDVVDAYAYMAAPDLGLHIFENLLTGIEEENYAPIESSGLGSTIFSSPLLLPEDKNCRVFDITGRIVVPDKIKPGIYFIEINGQITRKVVKVR